MEGGPRCRTSVTHLPNFTDFLDNPVDGDQFNQRDSRTVTAVHARHVWATC